MAEDRSRLLTALSPRARVEWRPTPMLGVYASAGTDVLLSNFSYILDDPDGRTLLEPHRVRFVSSVGIAVYP